MIRVLVVDDQAMFRVGLAAILDAQPDISVAGEAEDGTQALARARSLRPDVVLMDVRMPGMNGIDATAAILGDTISAHRPRVVMLTTFDIDDYVFAALRAGASGFLLKDAAPDDLVAAVRTVHAGDALLAPRVTRMLVEELLERPAPAPKRDVLVALTERERDVFMLMARGMSNSDIARRLYIAEQTTKTHVSRILGKLGLPDRVHAVVLGYEAGLVRPGDPLPE
ncbi:response regulator [Isoptericola cucumis]|jgi:DNA-binding NarL/FixJ family response regulator|uniref:DNA-binding response regulator n=1 Tax=Isoptericola cucumis TaxID=1776856 RepID=A0ABQ2BC69_9MICO|nr:response regulator transcription factor [Isoptericola cucumis]GGI10877.1 DNA-binding response regulator [Isoptericola cucumis]